MKTQYSLALRIWHWLNGFVVLGLLGTYFLRQTLFAKGTIQRLFIDTLARSQITIDDAAAKSLRGALVDQLWGWHINLGYALGVLLLIRIVLFVVEGKRSTFFTVPQRHQGLKGKGIQALYGLFYLSQIVMVASGFAMLFDESLGLTDAFKHNVAETHETLMWFFVGFIVLHIGGAVVAENSDEPGIVSRMINGGS